MDNLLDNPQVPVRGPLGKRKGQGQGRCIEGEKHDAAVTGAIA